MVTERLVLTFTKDAINESTPSSKLSVITRAVTTTFKARAGMIKGKRAPTMFEVRDLLGDGGSDVRNPRH